MKLLEKANVEISRPLLGALAAGFGWGGAALIDAGGTYLLDAGMGVVLLCVGASALALCLWLVFIVTEPGENG